MQRIKPEREREREERHKTIIQVPSTNRKQSCLPCTSKQSSLKCNIRLQLLNATTSTRLQITQAQLQEISYAQARKQETSNAQEQLQETSIAQAHKQETSIQTELQRSLFQVEHLLYNQWCSQYKSDTDSYDSRISKI